MQTKIYPDCLDKYQQELLFKFFQEQYQANVFFWEAGQRYSYASKEYLIFQHHVVCRYRKPHILHTMKQFPNNFTPYQQTYIFLTDKARLYYISKDLLIKRIAIPDKKRFLKLIHNLDFSQPCYLPPETGVDLRYEFYLDKFVGQGGMGTIYQVDGTMVLHTNSYHYKTFQEKSFKNHSRVVKYVPDKKSVLEKFVKKEYELTKNLPWISPKAPIKVHHNIYQIMHYIPGKTLSDILKDDLFKKSLSNRMRYQLSLALLDALYQQVTRLKIIHRDIKPENIIINLRSDAIKVFIIDYGLSISKQKKWDGSSVGTKFYAPPEFYQKIAPTYKADVYAMGKVLSALWRVDAYALKKTFKNKEDLSIELDYIPPSAKARIQTILFSMLQPDVNLRLSVKAAQAAFHKITIPSEYAFRNKALRKAMDWMDVLKQFNNQLDGDKYADLKDDLNHLIEVLQENYDQLWLLEKFPFKEKGPRITENSIELIKKLSQQHRITLDHGARCNQLIANIYLALVSLGVGYLAAISVNRAITGNYLFFPPTFSQNLRTNIAQTLHTMISTTKKITEGF